MVARRGMEMMASVRRSLQPMPSTARSARVMFGYSEAELVGEHVDRLVAFRRGHLRAR